MAIIGSLLEEHHVPRFEHESGSEDELPQIEEEIEESLVHNIRVSLPKDVDATTDGFEYAMNFLYGNFSAKENVESCAEMVAVPHSVRL
jgi:hypothetical protein